MNYDRVTIFCFAASYALAFLLELVQQRWPGAVLRWSRLLAAGAGIVAHVIYLVLHAQPLAGNTVALVVLSLVLAIFYFVGAIRHARQAWGLFVLPVVLLLVVLASLTSERDVLDIMHIKSYLQTQQALTYLHVGMLVLGEVGLCVSAIAAVMYLVQQGQLKADVPPTHRLPLLSLERLEAMQRHGLDWAFPLLSLGLLIGIALMFLTSIELSWFDPKVIATVLLWLTVGLLVWLRHGVGLRGRRVAWGALLAFGLMLGAFAVSWIGRTSHPTAAPKRVAVLVVKEHAP